MLLIPDNILSFIYIVILLDIAFIIYMLVLENRDPAKTLAWILIFLLFPVFGWFAYIFFGMDYRKNKIFRLGSKISETNFQKLFHREINEQKNHITSLKNRGLSTEEHRLMNMLLNASNAPLTTGNSMQILYTGKEKFDILYDDILHAKKSIYVEYYILSSDPLGKKFIDLLIKKKKENLDVKILVDAIGALGKLKHADVRRLRRNGVEFKYSFDPSFKGYKFNYRNHRKIVVIDETIGYMGGMNLSEEYLTGGKKFDSWSDLHFKFKGPSVHMLLLIFANDWWNVTREEIRVKHEKLLSSSLFGKGVPMQIVASGPDSKQYSIKELYFSMIMAAKKRIFIVTPFFIPDQSMLSAIKNASLSGIDVTILITGHPNERLPFWAAETYFAELLNYNIKIYKYNAGYLHTKSIVVDDEYFTIGSANMDIRSYILNYEVNAVIYDSTISKKLLKRFNEDLKKSSLVTLDDLMNKHIFLRLRDSLTRLLSPLL